MAEYSYSDYAIGWICALPLEMAAAKAMLDKPHPKLTQPPNDTNLYLLGEICGHNVVIACLPYGVYGTTSAATVAAQMMLTFPAIRLGLMVGIGGGAPSKKADIRLGDVVISRPSDALSGVVHYDFGRVINGGAFERTGSLNKPPEALLAAMAGMEMDRILGASQIPQLLSKMVTQYPSLTQSTHRGQDEDLLFKAEYEHEEEEEETCEHCDKNRLMTRQPRPSTDPQIHYGLIASADKVMKHGGTRDRLARELGILCFEMEAAGLMDHFPCVVIRGICDYSDSHKNKQWQPYAAAVAAASAKELLSHTPVRQVEKIPTARDIVSTANHPFHLQFDLKSMPAANSFYGRKTNLSRLWQTLDPQRSNMRKVVVLHGSSGMGKTQLAINFARTHKAAFTAVLWLNGRNRAAIVRSLASFAPRAFPSDNEIVGDPKDDKDAKDRADRVVKWLATESNSMWLIIIDNVPDQHASASDDDEAGVFNISEYFPPVDHGSVIIITSSPSHLLSSLGESHVLERLPADEATQLLTKVAGPIYETTLTTDSHADKESLAAQLDYFPLSLVVAGSSARHTQMSVREYSQSYEKSRGALKDTMAVSKQQKTDVSTTLLIAYRKINDPATATLLLLLSFFDNQDIWFELIHYAAKSPTAPSWLSQVASKKSEFSKAMQLLTNLSLVEASQASGAYSLHSCVQDWCKRFCESQQDTKIGHGDLVGVFLTSVCSATLELFKEDSSWALRQRLLPHMNRMFIILKNISNIPPDLSVIRAIKDVGSLYLGQGKPKQAEIMIQQALAGYEKTLGPKNIETLLVVNYLGYLYWTRKQPDLSEAMFQRSLTGFNEALIPTHTYILETRRRLGVVYRDKGMLGKAEDMFRQALEGYEKWPTPDYAAMLPVLANLSNVYRVMAKLDDAEQISKRALASCEMLHGKKAIHTLDAVFNLGAVLYDKGQLNDAVPLFQRSLQGYEQALPVNHAAILVTLNSLGCAYRLQKRFGESKDALRKAINGFKETVGMEDVNALEAMTNMALVYKDEGNLEEAEDWCQKAFAGFEKTLGQKHIMSLLCTSTLASIYCARSKLQQAEDMCRRVLDGYAETSTDPDHTLIFFTTYYLGVVYSQDGRTKEAEKMIQRALDGFEKKLGSENLFTIRAWVTLARLHEQMGEPHRAQAEYHRALPGFKKVLGHEDVETQLVVKKLEALKIAGGEDG